MPRASQATALCCTPVLRATLSNHRSGQSGNGQGNARHTNTGLPREAGTQVVEACMARVRTTDSRDGAQSQGQPE